MSSDNTTSNGNDQPENTLNIENSVTENTQECNSTEQDASASNVINLYTKEPVCNDTPMGIIQIAGEYRSTRMLYTSYDHPERLIAVPILCWALTDFGEVVGMVPWMDEILPCEEIEEKYSVSWEGYYCPREDDIFFEPPAEMIAQLTATVRFPKQYLRSIEATTQTSAALKYSQPALDIVQEIPDLIGTHALLINDESDSLILTSVISWVLDEKGELSGMLADDCAIEKLPVLPGDSCLYSAAGANNFKCYFQRDIAEQIRTENPETLEAIEQLFSN